MPCYAVQELHKVQEEYNNLLRKYTILKNKLKNKLHSIRYFKKYNDLKLKYNKLLKEHDEFVKEFNEINTKINKKVNDLKTRFIMSRMIHHRKQDIFLSSKYVDENDECCICKKKVEDNKTYLCMWTCGHWQCLECWDEYRFTCLINNQNRTCPLCRQDFGTEPYYLVFKYINNS